MKGYQATFSDFWDSIMTYEDRSKTSGGIDDDTEKSTVIQILDEANGVIM